MSATIIGGDNAEFEPEIISDNGRDGITAFQFSVVGRNVSDLYPIDAVVNNVPGQPSGSFRVVRRNLQNIVEGLQRLSVSAEGGTANGLYISEAGYQYNESQEPGVVTLPLAQIQVQYKLIWLAPSVTVTTNSAAASDGPARALAQQIISNMGVEIIQNRPAQVNGGKKINVNDIRITGSSIEKAGGLWRVRATATKGQIPA
jgi:hypothetical protein